MTVVNAEQRDRVGRLKNITIVVLCHCGLVLDALGSNDGRRGNSSRWDEANLSAFASGLDLRDVEVRGHISKSANMDALSYNRSHFAIVVDTLRPRGCSLKLVERMCWRKHASRQR